MQYTVDGLNIAFGNGCNVIEAGQTDIFFLVGIVLVLSSCKKVVANKGGYDDYNVGMYINGVEYHEKIRSLFSPPIFIKVILTHNFYFHNRN